MNTINYNDFPKGTMVKILYVGYYDTYVGIVIRNLKNKVVIQTLTLNGKLYVEIKDFSKQNIRTIDILQ